MSEPIPTEALAAVDAAAARAEALAADNLEVHFEVHPLTGAVRAELRQLDTGGTVRTLGPSEVLALLS